MKRFIAIATLVIGSTALGVAASAGSYRYVSTDIPGGPDAIPTAINNRDQVVGNFVEPDVGGLGRYRAFTIENGLTTIVTGPDFGGFADLEAVNDHGVAVGYNAGKGCLVYRISDGSVRVIRPHAFLLCVGIDDAGDIVGNYDQNSGFAAFIIADGKESILSVAGDPYDYVRGISRSGLVLLSSVNQARLYYQGQYTKIESAPEEYATAITSGGELLGGGSPRGFVFRTSTDVLTQFRFPGSCETIPAGTDGHGVLAGSVSLRSANCKTIAGFVKFAGNYFTIHYPGSTYTDIIAINVRQTLIGRYALPNNTLHGFIAYCDIGQRPCIQ